MSKISEGNKRVRFLLEKLLFKDIVASNDIRHAAAVRRAKQLALTAIAVVFIAGSILTAGYAFSYYNTLKEDFFADQEPIEELDDFNPSAVWFTQELGDPYRIQGILAYLNTFEDGRLILDVVNVNDISVELISVQDLDGNYTYPFTENKILIPSPDYQPQSYTFENIAEAMLARRSEIIVNYQYDDGIPHQAAVIPFKKIDDGLFNATSIRITDNTTNFKFIRQDSSKIWFEGEQISIAQPLYIPGGKTLYISAGQKIDLVNNAYIVSRAPVVIEGNASQPVHFRTSDGSGRGLLVMQARQASRIVHTIFDGLDTPRSGLWELTGSVTFYEADVDISHSTFINNPSEDGLNIIRSHFAITDSYFGKTASDAFDADFSEGLISRSVFENTTNDAIDVSGSDIEVRDTATRNNGDKGISVGENSRISLQNISIDQAMVGIASKDHSIITGNNIHISNSRIALTLYIKKPEFGPANISLENLTLSGDIDLDYLIQPGSTLTIDGRLIHPRAAKKETLLFEKMINGEPIQ